MSKFSRITPSGDFGQGNILTGSGGNAGEPLATNTTKENLNVLQFYKTPEEFIETLLSGKEEQDTEFKQECEASGGYVMGLGRNCAPEREDSLRDYFTCVYRGSYDCLRALKDDVYEQAVKAISGTFNNIEAPGRFNSSVRVSMVGLRDEMREKEQDYADCLKDVAEDCGCQVCVYDLAIGQEPEDEDLDDLEPEVDEVETPEIDVRYAEFRTQSGFLPIPRIWGRFLTSGNVIFMSNPTTTVAGTIVEESDRRRRDTVVFNTTVRMKLGLCYGEVEELLRLFIADNLLLDRTLNLTEPSQGTTTLDLSPLAGDDEQLLLRAVNKPSISLVSGSSAQKVLAQDAATHGFGRAVAHRDLAYVEIEDLSLNLMGESFPEIRADITTSAENVDDNFKQSSVQTYITTGMNYDPNTGVLLVRRTDGTFDELDTDSLALRTSIEVPLATSVNYPVASGMYASVFDNRMSFYDRAFENERVFYGSNVRSFVRRVTPNGRKLIRDFTFTQFEDVARYNATVEISDNNRLELTLFNYTRGDFTSRLISSTTLPPSVAPSALTLSRVSGILSADVFYIPNVSSYSISVYSYALLNTGEDFTNPSSITPTVRTLPLTDFGGTGNIVVTQMVEVKADNSVILFLSRGSAQSIVKVSLLDWSIVWENVSPNPFTKWTDDDRSLVPSDEMSMLYISNDMNIVRLNFYTGEETVITSLSADSLPEYTLGRAQIYDGILDSLYYFDNDGAVTRAFFGKRKSVDVSVLQIMRDIVSLATNDQLLTTTVAATDYDVTGFGVFSRVPANTSLEELSKVYGYEMTTSPDGVIVSDHSVEISTPVVLEDNIDRISVSSLSVGSLLERYTINYYEIGPEGLAQSKVEVTNREVEDAATIVSEQSLQVMLLSNKTSMALSAERLLNRAREETEQLSFTGLPINLSVYKDDTVLFDSKYYKVSSLEVSPDNRIGLIATRLSEDTAVSSILQEETQYAPLTPRVRKASVLRPEVLFCNAVTNDHAFKAATDRQIVYTAIRAGTEDIPTTRVYVKTVSHLGSRISIDNAESNSDIINIPASPLYVSLDHDKAAHAGIVSAFGSDVTEGVPDDPFEIIGFDIEGIPIFAGDGGGFANFDSNTSRPLEFVDVSFDRQDTVDYVLSLPVYDSPYYEIQDDPTANLLIWGRELLQFGQAELIDEESLTVRFSYLFRGVRGTEPYYGEHTEGDTVYLYTPDTIRPMRMDSEFTKRRTIARVWTTPAIGVGASPIEHYYLTDAGSSRPWAPVVGGVFMKNNDEGILTLRLFTRVPVTFNQQVFMGDLENVWKDGRIMVTISNFSPSLETIESDTNFDFNILNVPENRLQTRDQNGYLTDFSIYVPTFDTEYFATKRYVTLAQVAKTNTGELVMGHPRVLEIQSGLPDTYPNLTVGT